MKTIFFFYIVFPIECRHDTWYYNNDDDDNNNMIIIIIITSLPVIIYLLYMSFKGNWTGIMFYIIIFMKKSF